MSKFWNLFKRKDPEFLNCLHPKYAKDVEPAFKCGSIQYYRMKEEIIMPYGRYKEFSIFLSEVDLRMTKRTLTGFLDKLEDVLNGTKGNGVILGDAFKVIWSMRSRLTLDFEPETARKLATVVYFDESESLIEYDPEHGQKKLKIWDKCGGDAFFLLTKPMDELLGLKGISAPSLIDYISQARELLNDPTLEQPKVS